MSLARDKRWHRESRFCTLSLRSVSFCRVSAVLSLLTRLVLYAAHCGAVFVKLAMGHYLTPEVERWINPPNLQFVATTVLFGLRYGTRGVACPIVGLAPENEGTFRGCDCYLRLHPSPKLVRYRRISFCVVDSNADLSTKKTHERSRSMFVVHVHRLAFYG